MRNVRVAREKCLGMLTVMLNLRQRREVLAGEPFRFGTKSVSSCLD